MKALIKSTDTSCVIWVSVYWANTDFSRQTSLILIWVFSSKEVIGSYMLAMYVQRMKRGNWIFPTNCISLQSKNYNYRLRLDINFINACVSRLKLINRDEFTSSYKKFTILTWNFTYDLTWIDPDKEWSLYFVFCFMLLPMLTS